jgi:hemolysin activation/secretion protein
VYGFYDVGKVWFKGLRSTYKDKSLASTGVGLKTDVLEAIGISLEVAKPLTKNIAFRKYIGKSTRPLRFFFKIETLF